MYETRMEKKKKILNDTMDPVVPIVCNTHNIIVHIINQYEVNYKHDDEALRETPRTTTVYNVTQNLLPTNNNNYGRIIFVNTHAVEYVQRLTFGHAAGAGGPARIQEVEVVRSGWWKREGNMTGGSANHASHRGQYRCPRIEVHDCGVLKSLFSSSFRIA